MKMFKDLESEENSWLYLLHHIHHKKDGSHEIHHCFVLDKEGNQYKIEHFNMGNDLLHIVLSNPPDVVMDHIGNLFIIETMKINENEYKILVGPKL